MPHDKPPDNDVQAAGPTLADPEGEDDDVRPLVAAAGAEPASQRDGQVSGESWSTTATTASCRLAWSCGHP
jgi:hypothetical protein